MKASSNWQRSSYEENFLEDDRRLFFFPKLFSLWENFPQFFSKAISDKLFVSSRVSYDSEAFIGSVLKYSSFLFFLGVLLSSLKLLYWSSCLPIKSFNRIKIWILNSPNLYLRFIYAWISPSANSVFAIITMYNITSIDLHWEISTTDKLLLRNVHFDELADLFFRVFVWVLLMFHPTSTLNRKDCRIVFLSVFVELNVLDTGLRFYGRFPDFFTHRFFIVERSEVTVATKRSRKIRPVKRAAIFCTFSLRLPHWERPISTTRLIIRSWLIGVERRLLIVGLRTLYASSSINDPK